MSDDMITLGMYDDMLAFGYALRKSGINGPVGGIMKTLSAALLLLATPAFASDDDAYTTVGEWSIFRNTTDCAALASFEDDEIVGFYYDAKDKTTEVVFTYKDGTSLKEDEERTLAIYLIHPNGEFDDGWESVKFYAAVGSDSTRRLRSQALKHPALNDFRRARTMAFFYGDKKIASYNMSGTSAALAEIERCSQRLHNINPRDVFAK